MIAMALACKPALLIADEPTTALDVTIQAQILDLMQDLQDRIGIAILFISHNLAVVSEVAHDIVVMYAGVSWSRPLRPRCLPIRSIRTPVGLLPRCPTRTPVIAGGVLDMGVGLVGCRFADRCPRVLPSCRMEDPVTVEAAPGHFVACFRAGQ